MKRCAVLLPAAAEDAHIAAYSLSRWCDWAVEHGMEVIIRDGRLLYAGASADFSPWKTGFYTEGESSARNFAIE